MTSSSTNSETEMAFSPTSSKQLKEDGQNLEKQPPFVLKLAEGAAQLAAA